ncbi:hypothetical protein BDN72DRAFT_947437 [Pluteus cervinus]|uniref:Uncharacterized protein n=1 Tax=Pluteus cervinus TaxID=181527 RepID=A0ACD3A2P9_9AGAR|nr:hypothetical protein BDN72DRAFT_947437 [Pluteus cervinus]
MFWLTDWSWRSCGGWLRLKRFAITYLTTDFELSSGCCGPVLVDHADNELINLSLAEHEVLGEPRTCTTGFDEPNSRQGTTSRTGIETRLATTELVPIHKKIAPPSPILHGIIPTVVGREMIRDVEVGLFETLSALELESSVAERLEFLDGQQISTGEVADFRTTWYWKRKAIDSPWPSPTCASDDISRNEVNQQDLLSKKDSDLLDATRNMTRIDIVPTDEEGPKLRLNAHKYGQPACYAPNCGLMGFFSELSSANFTFPAFLTFIPMPAQSHPSSGRGWRLNLMHGWTDTREIKFSMFITAVLLFVLGQERELQTEWETASSSCDWGASVTCEGCREIGFVLDMLYDVDLVERMQELRMLNASRGTGSSALWVNRKRETQSKRESIEHPDSARLNRCVQGLLRARIRFVGSPGSNEVVAGVLCKKRISVKGYRLVLCLCRVELTPKALRAAFGLVKDEDDPKPPKELFMCSTSVVFIPEDSHRTYLQGVQLFYSWKHIRTNAAATDCLNGPLSRSLQKSFDFPVEDLTWPGHLVSKVVVLTKSETTTNKEYPIVAALGHDVPTSALT